MNRLFALLLALATTFSTCALAAETKVGNIAGFDAAVKAAKPGDVIVLADGEWRNVDFKFHGLGGIEPDRKIKLRAETPGRVLLTGTTRLLIGGKHLEASGLLWNNTTARDHVIAFRIDSSTLAEDCRLRECAIIDDGADDGAADANGMSGEKKSGKAVERKWVSIYGRRNRVELCRFEGKKSAGALMVVWIPDDAPPYVEDRRPADPNRKVDAAVEQMKPRHEITRNFFGPREKLGKNGGETIRIGDSKTSLRVCETRVIQNYFYRCDGEAEIISNKSCKNNYAYNAFIGCSGALTLRHGNGCVVGMNLFHGDGRKGTGGVRVVGERHTVMANHFLNLTGDDARAALCVMNGIPDSPANGYLQVRKLGISGNVFVDCKRSILLGFADKDRADQTLAPDGVRLDDSIVIAGNPAVTIKTMPTNLLRTPIPTRASSACRRPTDRIGTTCSASTWNPISRSAHTSTPRKSLRWSVPLGSAPPPNSSRAPPRNPDDSRRSPCFLSSPLTSDP